MDFERPEIGVVPEEQADFSPEAALPALTVSELTRHIRSLFDSDEILQDVAVRGEMSNFRRYPSSGHMYFTLKDEQSQIPCVMFANANQHLSFAPEDGMRVVARGRVSVYEQRGQYQLYVRWMRYDGLGALFEAFEKLKRKLAAEGLFDQAIKRPIPAFPRSVGVVTSDKGAAVRDIITILGRRFPLAGIKLFPTLVQGAEAPRSIVGSIGLANRLGGTDVLIVGRGGGSIEDLWGFNNEAVARAIRASEIPVVSAVGHETDFTIADFAADLRAPTPSAAAELVAPDAQELRSQISFFRASFRNRLEGTLKRYQETLKMVGRGRLGQLWSQLIADWRQFLDEMRSGVEMRFNHLVSLRESELQSEKKRLEAMNPLNILQRGYSILERKADGALVSSVEQVWVGDESRVTVSDGTIDATVTGLQKERRRE